MNRIIRQVSLIGLVILAVTLAANAQSSQQYRADIPFSFEANGKQYAAGEYTIGPLSQVTVPGAIAIRSLNTGNARVLGVTSDMGNGNWDNPGKLIFRKVDGRHTLSQISTASFEMNMKVKKSRSNELAKGGADPVIVAIALKN